MVWCGVSSGVVCGGIYDNVIRSHAEFYVDDKGFAHFAYTNLIMQAAKSFTTLVPSDKSARRHPITLEPK